VNDHETVEALRRTMAAHDAEAPGVDDVLAGLDLRGAPTPRAHRWPALAAAAAVAAVLAIGVVAVPRLTSDEPAPDRPPVASQAPSPSSAPSASPGPARQVTVPDVVGLGREHAVEALDKVGLNMLVPAGDRVTATDPAAGTEVAAASVVRLAMSGAPAASGTPCRAPDLVVTTGPRIEPATGENPLSFRITNKGRPCTLTGSPGIVLRAADGRPLELSYIAGGYQAVSGAPATPVRLASAGSALLALDRYRCDAGYSRWSRTLEITWPGSGTTTTLDAVRYPQCTQDGPSLDPGNLVYVSPVRATYRDLLVH
jgi:hypothetical protein